MTIEELMKKYGYNHDHAKYLLQEEYVHDLQKEIESLKNEINKLKENENK